MEWRRRDEQTGDGSYGPLIDRRLVAAARSVYIHDGDDDVSWLQEGSNVVR